MSFSVRVNSFLCLATRKNDQAGLPGAPETWCGAPRAMRRRAPRTSRGLDGWAVASAVRQASYQEGKSAALRPNADRVAGFGPY
jgi:hypothetical protein